MKSIDEPSDITSSCTFDQLLSCQFSSWYPSFRNIKTIIDNEDNGKRKIERRKRRKNVTVKSIIIKPLQNDFIQGYMFSDGLILPKGATNVSSFVPNNEDDNYNNGNDDESWADDLSSSENHDEKDINVDEIKEKENQGKEGNQTNNHQNQQYFFPELNESITKAIKSLGGKVVPKLNWSSPRDAVWLHDSHTMECRTAGDVFLLLKGSDFVLHDILHALDDIDITFAEKDDNVSSSPPLPTQPSSLIDFEIVLRKWCNLYLSSEYRCFISNHELIGISQRDSTQYYAHIGGTKHSSLEERRKIKSTLYTFFQTYVKGRYADGAIDSYVMDAYIDKQDTVWIIDFNLMWNKRTDPLLFKWDDLRKLAEKISTEAKIYEGTCEEQVEESQYCDNPSSLIPEMRVVEIEKEVLSNPLSSYRGPIDAVNLASLGSETNTSNSSDNCISSSTFDEFRKLCERPSMM